MHLETSGYKAGKLRKLNMNSISTERNTELRQSLTARSVPLPSPDTWASPVSCPGSQSMCKDLEEEYFKIFL